ncbi:SGNH/GDSL hydrolase family protein [Vandammella animalimorsus]|uniref:SGNH/GDSL hydrolase family protein n=1 Tax=Vandammella animalimorsus TaxID=2029117 RepID=UPI001177F036|nr:SGNH/GDSL hydrolase family protein [Vandammella animalimorsus]
MATIVIEGLLRNGVTFHGDSIMEKRIFKEIVNRYESSTGQEDPPFYTGTNKKFFCWARSGHTSLWALDTYRNAMQFAMTRNHVIMLGANDVGFHWSPHSLGTRVKELATLMLNQRLHQFNPNSPADNINFITTSANANFKVLICGLPVMQSFQNVWQQHNNQLQIKTNELISIYGSSRVQFLNFSGLVPPSMVDGIGHPSKAAAATYASHIYQKCLNMGMQIA